MRSGAVHGSDEPRRAKRLSARAETVKERAGDPEVGDHDAPVVANEHVLRLEVTMDEPGRVGRREPTPGRLEDGECFAPRMRLSHPRFERAPLDVLHRDEDVVAVHTDVVDGDDVGMSKARHRLRFALQACSVVGRLCRGVEDFDRDAACELPVVRGVHAAHAAGAEVVDDDVSPDSACPPRPAPAGAREEAPRSA